MKPDKKDVKEVRNRLEQELEGFGEINTSEAVDLLTAENNEDRSLNYIIWRYGDKSGIDHHFRDFGYEDPNDFLNSLESMNGKKGRKYDRELRAIVDYTLDEIYSSLE